MSTTSTDKADAHVRSSVPSGNAKSVSIVDREKAAIAAGLFMATDTFVHHQFRCRLGRQQHKLSMVPPDHLESNARSSKWPGRR